jgi:hypothetical protein
MQADMQSPENAIAARLTLRFGRLLPPGMFWQKFCHPVAQLPRLTQFP